MRAEYNFKIIYLQIVKLSFGTKNNTQKLKGSL